MRYKLLRPPQSNIIHFAPVYLHGQPPQITQSAIRRQMFASGKTSVPHEVRTAAEPRQNRLYNVRLSHIEQVNPSIRLLQLTIPPESDGDQSQEDGEVLPICYSCLIELQI